MPTKLRHAGLDVHVASSATFVPFPPWEGA